MPTPEASAKILSIESKLIELDPIFQEFCFRYGFSLRTGFPLYPKRIVWHRSDIDRVLDLSPDVTVPEIMEKGFQPEMLWSLHAIGALLPVLRKPVRVLNVMVVKELSYVRLQGELKGHLEAGYLILRGFNQEAVILRGQSY